MSKDFEYFKQQLISKSSLAKLPKEEVDKIFKENELKRKIKSPKSKIDQYIDEAIQSFEKTAKNAKVAKIIHRPYYDEGELYASREPKPKPLKLLTAKRVKVPKEDFHQIVNYDDEDFVVTKKRAVPKPEPPFFAVEGFADMSATERKPYTEQYKKDLEAYKKDKEARKQKKLKRVMAPRPLKLKKKPIVLMDIKEPSKIQGHNYRASNYLNFTRQDLIDAIRKAEGYATSYVSTWRKDDLLKHYMKLYK